MADPNAAFKYRQQLREAERAQLYWQQKALEKDADNYTDGEYARALEPILNRRKELDRQEQEWKEAVDPLDFTPDADPRKLQDQEAVRLTRELNYPEPPQEYGRGQAEKFRGKTPAKSPVARKEAAAEMDAAMETTDEEGSEESEESEEEEDDDDGEASPVDDARARRMSALSSSSSDDDEVPYDQQKDIDQTNERRRKEGLYEDEAGSNVNAEEQDQRYWYLNAYEAFVTSRAQADTRALLAELKEAVEFYVRQADLAVRSAEACEEATKAVVRAIEERDASEDDCEKVLASVKDKAETLRSTVAKALNDAYSTEELAADVQEVHAYAEQQMEESNEPYARAQELSEQKKVGMFKAVELLMARNRVKFDIKKFLKIRDGGILSEDEGEEEDR